MGSAVSGLYIRVFPVKDRLLPNSDVNFIVCPRDVHPLELFTSALSAHLYERSLFRDVQIVMSTSGYRICALHIVGFRLLPKE